jgi:hypothetical protein
MTRIWKFVAVVASIAVFAMPAATLSLHCVLMPPLGDNPHQHCRMMVMNPSADQIDAAPVNHSCCTVSAAKTETPTVPRAPAGTGIVAPQMSVAFLSDLPAVPAAYEPFDRDMQSPGGPPQAFLCTFLI